MLNLTQMSNIRVPGQFVFGIDERDIINNAGKYIPVTSSLDFFIHVYNMHKANKRITESENKKNNYFV